VCYIKTEQLRVTGATVLIDRPSTSVEKDQLNTNRVFDTVDYERLPDLSGEGINKVAELPIPTKPGPVKHIYDLYKETFDKYLDLLSQEILNVIDATREIKYTTRRNVEKTVSLCDVIENTWKPYWKKYWTVEEDEDSEPYINKGGPWFIIFGLADIFNRKKLYLNEALAKLHEEGEIRHSKTRYEEDGKLWYHEPDNHIRIGAWQLTLMGLAKYIPEWYSNIRWEPNKKFKSFKQFHKTIDDRINKSIEEYDKKNQSIILLGRGKQVLDDKEGRIYLKKLYPNLLFD